MSIVSASGILTNEHNGPSFAHEEGGAEKGRVPGTRACGGLLRHAEWMQRHRTT